MDWCVYALQPAHSPAIFYFMEFLKYDILWKEKLYYTTAGTLQQTANSCEYTEEWKKELCPAQEWDAEI